MGVFFIYMPPIIYEENAIRVKYFLHIVTIFYKKKAHRKGVKRWAMVYTYIAHNLLIVRREP